MNMDIPEGYKAWKKTYTMDLNSAVADQLPQLDEDGEFDHTDVSYTAVNSDSLDTMVFLNNLQMLVTQVESYLLKVAKTQKVEGFYTTVKLHGYHEHIEITAHGYVHMTEAEKKKYEKALAKKKSKAKADLKKLLKQFPDLAEEMKV